MQMNKTQSFEGGISPHRAIRRGGAKVTFTTGC
jgi:hypothetical protein